MIAVLIENDVVVTPLAQLEVAEKGGTFFQIMAPAGNSMYIYVLDAVVYYMFISSIKGD